MECARKVFRQEGFGAFYRSYTTQLVMNLPYQAIHFSTYEFLQETVSNKIINRMRKKKKFSCQSRHEYIFNLQLLNCFVIFFFYYFIQLNKERRYSPMVHVVAGGAAGAGRLYDSYKI